MITILICSIATAISTWVLIPCLFSHDAAVLIVMLVVCSLVLMMFDRGISKRHILEIFITYAMCGMLSLLLWIIWQREFLSLMSYGANSIIVWYPVAFANYLIRRKPPAKYVRRMVLIIILTACITVITTLFGLQTYPYGSRWLAGSNTVEVRAILRKMNIGGYGFIYMLAIAYPIIVSFAFSKLRMRFVQSLAFVLVVGVPAVILYSQYMIALYMILFTILVLLVNIIVRLVLRVNSSNFRTFLITIPSVAIIFIVLLNPINSAISLLGYELELVALQERANDTIKSLDSQDAFDSVYSLIATEESITSKEHALNQGMIVQNTEFTEDANNDLVEILREQELRPIVGRLDVYKRIFRSFPTSPWLGKAVNADFQLTYHSDILDGLLGGGVVGGVIFLSILCYIAIRIIKVLCIPHWLVCNSLLSFFLLLGLGLVNTVFTSREILLMGMILIASFCVIEGENQRLLI